MTKINEITHLFSIDRLLWAVKYSNLKSVSYYKLRGGANDGKDVYGNDDEHVYGGHDVQDEKHEDVHGKNDRNGHDGHGYGHDDEENAGMR
ncbi:hypothetical protein [Paenibacillus sp. FSL E2-0178]|uniref:hypothetical protein n=1 Tax=Paenibacillus sp. FSL E2-0178 TaxID=2921361 RepID=UPI003158F6F0